MTLDATPLDVNQVVEEVSRRVEAALAEEKPASPMPSIEVAPALNWDELMGFTSKQQQALDAIYAQRFILYGGARGGGKSYFLRWAAVDFLITCYEELGLKGVHVGLFCETYPDLRDRQISKIKMEFPSWLGRLRDTKEEGLAFILDDSLGGGVIALRNLDDASKYQSAEFAAIFVDELTKTLKETFDILRGSLRWPGVSHTVFAGATNPGSIGHAWVKGLWIDRQFPPEMQVIKDQFAFIQSLPSDNPHLDETYWQDLNTLPEELRRAWVLGDWNVFKGQAFPSWGPQHIVDTFDIPGHWPRTVGIDWGYAAPFAAVWLAQNPQTKQYVQYRELYAKQLTDEEQAQAVFAHSVGEFVRFYFADPSMWTRSTQKKSGLLSTADIYLQNGIFLQKADNNRLSGKRKLDRLLMNTVYGEPGYVVQKQCKETIRTMPSLPYDKTRIEDVDTKAEDHLFDALKYALSAASGPSTQIAQALASQNNTGRRQLNAHPLLVALSRKNRRS
jgi:phage terminase large subunit